MSWIFFDLDQPGAPSTDLDIFNIQDFSVNQDANGLWWVYGTLRSVHGNVIVYDFRNGIRWDRLFNGTDPSIQEKIVSGWSPILLKFRASGII